MVGHGRQLVSQLADKHWLQQRAAGLGQKQPVIVPTMAQQDGSRRCRRLRIAGRGPVQQQQPIGPLDGEECCGIGGKGAQKSGAKANVECSPTALGPGIPDYGGICKVIK